MNDIELFKSEALKGVSGSSDYRILAIDGKAVLAEKFSSPVPQPSTTNISAANKTLMIGAIVLFGLGAAVGAHYQAGADAQKIQNLQAENLILESKISKIRDLVK